ncbi:MAG: energy transducer TonB [Flavobacteriaceae bacterium]|nr:energy transducer TonB [Flavobacteriaceae bacterium]
MNKKKNPKADLENYSKLFILLGLVLALYIVYVSIEHKAFDSVDDLSAASLSSEDEEDVEVAIFQEMVKPPPPPPPPPPLAAVETILIVDDDEDIEETEIESTETDEEEEVVIEEDDDEEVIEDVPFMLIQDAPVYPGCEKKKSKEDRKKCLSKKISKLINRKFNTELASELGLSAGNYKINIMFKINHKGLVSDIMVRAPHPKLKKEAIRVVKLLPKMTPGKQRNKPVSVSYTLPISFKVE